MNNIVIAAEARRPFWGILPTKHAEWEVLLMRLGFALLLWYRLPAEAPWESQPYPNGAASFLDLTCLADAAFFAPVRWVFLAMLALYVSGRWTALALTYLLVVNVAYYTLGNSQGWIGHTDQIVSLVLLAQTVFHLGVAGRKLLGKPWRPALERSVGDWEVFYTLQTIGAAYLVAGLTKLIKTGGTWIAQLPNITVQIVKTNDQFYYDKLTHPNPGLAEWLNQMLITHPWTAYPIFVPGLLVELAAVLVIFGRRPAALLGLVLLGMHGLISLLMQITFTTNILLIVVYLLNIPFWSVALFRWFQGRDQGRPIS